MKIVLTKIVSKYFTWSNFLADILALLKSGETVGASLAAAVRELLAGSSREVEVILGEGSSAWTRVHLCSAHVCVE